MHAHWHLKLLCIYKTVDIVGTSLTWFTKRPYYRQLVITGTEWIVLATFRLACFSPFNKQTLIIPTIHMFTNVEYGAVKNAVNAHYEG